MCSEVIWELCPLNPVMLVLRLLWLCRVASRNRGVKWLWSICRSEDGKTWWSMTINKNLARRVSVNQLQIRTLCGTTDKQTDQQSSLTHLTQTLDTVIPHPAVKTNRLDQNKTTQSECKYNFAIHMPFRDDTTPFHHNTWSLRQNTTDTTL